MGEMLKTYEEELEIKEGFKNTKIGWIPDDWEICELKDLAKIQTGNKDTQNKVLDGEYPFFVRSQNISKINTYSFDGEAVLTSGDGVGVGKNYHYINGKFDYHQRVYCISDFNSKLSGKYFYNYFSEHFYRRVSRLSAKNSVDSVRMEMIANMLIPLPSYTEQQKIASILSDWDVAIEKVQTLIEKLELRKKGLMQKLLTGKKRLPGFSEEWQEVTLGDITDRITNKNTELNDNVVTISAQRGFVRQEDFFNKRVASSTLSGYFLINKCDFAYNKSYSNGYPMGAFKRLDDFDKAVVTTLYICFSIKDNVDSDFLVNYFEAGLMVKNLMRIAQEGGRAHGLLNIGLKDFFGLKMKIPSVVEQKAIAEILNTADQEIKQQQHYLEQLQNQKKGLMQQLLIGKIRVKV